MIVCMINQRFRVGGVRIHAGHSYKYTNCVYIYTYLLPNMHLPVYMVTQSVAYTNAHAHTCARARARGREMRPTVTCPRPRHTSDVIITAHVIPIECAEHVRWHDITTRRLVPDATVSCTVAGSAGLVSWSQHNQLHITGSSNVGANFTTAAIIATTTAITSIATVKTTATKTHAAASTAAAAAAAAAASTKREYSQTASDRLPCQRHIAANA